MDYCGKTTEELITELNLIDSKEFYQSYIINEEIWYFNNFGKNISSVEYNHSISSIINKNFNLTSNEFLIVGSAKIGFSLSPNKNFKLFNREGEGNENQSDIDIAIISSELFVSCWEKLKALKYRTYMNNYTSISSNIFRGFVNDKNMTQQISLTLDILDMIDRCTIDIRDEFEVIEPINYRIYNSWDDLERYTINGINICKGEKNGI